MIYKHLVGLILFLTFVTGSAQTQQGIVKTRGRVVNGLVVPGTRLTGATITLNIGNPLVSGQDGVFSFNVPTGKTYSLVAAKKQGYTLADPEYTHRSFSYSASNPFYVVLEDEAQRQADINAATRKVRRTLTAQLQAREDEIEALKEQNKLTEAEYQKRLQELYDNQSKSEQLVKEMAERFAAIDYDQLDDFNRQVQQYIEEGELLKADSLINSRGSLEERYARVGKQESVNTQRQEEIRQQQESLAKSRELTQREREDLMSDLYAKHSIFLQTFQQDSALYCLKLRADLDTTIVDNVLDYALLCDKQKKFDECVRYYEICLRASVNKDDMIYYAFLLQRVGKLLLDLNNTIVSGIYLKEAWMIYEQLNQQNPDVFLPELAHVLYSLGELHFKLDNPSVSEGYFKASLENTEKLFSENPDEYRIQLVANFISMGTLYSNKKDTLNSEKYYKLALEHLEKIPDDDSDQYLSVLADLQNSLGVLYDDPQNYDKSEKYHKAALENYETLFRKKPDAYRKNMAEMQLSIGGFYYIHGDYATCERYYKAALENAEYLFGIAPNASFETLGKSQLCLGMLYYTQENYPDSEKYLKLALGNYEIFTDQVDPFHIADLAGTRFYLALLYQAQQDYTTAEIYFKVALSNYKQLYQDEHKEYLEVCASINWILMVYAEDSDSPLYRDSLEETWELYAILYKNQPEEYIDDWIDLHIRKIRLLLADGRNDEVLDMWKKVNELNPNFLDNYSEDTELSNGLKKLGLIE